MHTTQMRFGTRRNQHSAAVNETLVHAELFADTYRARIPVQYQGAPRRRKVLPKLPKKMSRCQAFRIESGDMSIVPRLGPLPYAVGMVGQCQDLARHDKSDCLV